MTSIAADIDPAVEKVIRRCLDPDSAKRPPTALAVAAALPGGDPLAVALAAGETPSPDLVASAGKTEGIALRYSLTALAAALVCILAALPLKQSKIAFYQAPLEYPPDVLRQKARDVAATLGYTKKPADTTLSLNQRLELLTYLDLRPHPRDWPRWLASEAPFSATYREGPQPLVATPTGNVTSTNPPMTNPGMVTLEIDGHGRLRGFVAVPYPQTDALTEPVPAEAVFRAAQLDISKFSEIPPRSVPGSASDQLHAWKGPHPGIPNMDLTVEIASWKGRVTYVKFLWPWTAEAGSQPKNPALMAKVRAALLPIVVCCGMIFAIVLARRNWKLDRADRRGALQIAIAMFLLSIIVWAGTAHLPLSDVTLGMSLNAAAFALFYAALLFVLYVALEPALRARWPHSIVTWNRVLTGRWRDAQVAAHILIGAAAGLLMWTVVELRGVLTISKYGLDTTGGLFLLTGTRQWIAGVASRLSEALETGLFVFFVIFALRTVLRKDWLAAIGAALIFSLLQADLANSLSWQFELISYVLLYSTLMFVLLRLGLVATISAVFFLNLINGVTLGTDLNTWYAPTGLASIALILAIVVYVFKQSLGARELAESAP